jgi:RHS repeat-associated protein
MLTDGRNTYTWNAESQIKTAAGVGYTYDGDGDRVQKSNGKIYWYGAGSEILDESDSSGNITDEYIFFGGKRIAHGVVSGNAIYYYAEDFLGSSRVMTTSTGTVCYDADFYPYGGERVVTNTCQQNYKFTGKERDAETNNDDFGARYYSSQFGRWISPDWSAIPAPVPYANLSNPQTLNLYAMVHDNPETFADLDGHEDNMLQAGKVSVGGEPQNPTEAKNPPQEGSAAAAVIGCFTSGACEEAATAAAPSILAIAPAAAMVLALVSPPMEQGDPMTPGYMPAPPIAAPMASQNTNPYAGPVSAPVTVVDPKGNAIPVKTGEQIQGSKDGRWAQVKDAKGQPTGTRIDGGHPASTHPDTRAQAPHAHVPGVKNADGTPWLPVR